MKQTALVLARGYVKRTVLVCAFVARISTEVNGFLYLIFCPFSVVNFTNIL